MPGGTPRFPQIKLSYLPQLLQNIRILDLLVLRQQQDLRQNFCRLGILVDERQEDLPSLLRVHRQNIDHSAALLVDHAAAKLNVVISESSFDESMRSFEGNICESEEFHVELEDCLAHLDRGVAGLRIYATRMGHTYCKIHVTHNF